jgi:hypothetical protein
MSKFKKFFKSSGAVVLALVVAAGLLVFAGIGAARAAQNFESNVLETETTLQRIGLSLYENGSLVARRNYNEADDGTWDQVAYEGLLANVPANPVLGEKYEEKLHLVNTGTINEYVRVTIYRYWKDASGAKDPAADESLIELGIPEGSGWIRDTKAETDERVVLYYSSLLNSGDPTSTFLDTVTINNKIATMISEEPDKEDPTLTHIVYAYDGYQICLEVEADAVQEKNANDAVKSAWGVDYVTVDTAAGTLSVNQ